MTRHLEPLLALPLAVEQMLAAEAECRLPADASRADYSRRRDVFRQTRARVAALTPLATQAALDAERVTAVARVVDQGARCSTGTGNAIRSDTHTGDTA